MNRYLKTFISLGLAVIFTCLFSLTAWASLLEYEVTDRFTHLGFYAEIEGSAESGWGAPNGAIDVFDYYLFEDVFAHRGGEFTWFFSHESTDTGFSIYSNMAVSTYYEYEPDVGPFGSVGYAYAYSLAGYFYAMMLRIPPTDQMPIGSIVSFKVQTETWGTPWAACEWEFDIAGVTVNQDNYEQAVFNLEVGKYYSFSFEFPDHGMETQKIEDGYLQSGFNLHFSRVPIPGAIWLLGSGLVGLIGLKRKYFN